MKNYRVKLWFRPVEFDVWASSFEDAKEKARVLYEEDLNDMEITNIEIEAKRQWEK